MSILDKATLLVTPNAYKTSKIYSIIPSDGSGDFSFSRASNATIINSTGQYEIVGTNMPRIDYDFSGGCPTILLEPQRTNLFRDSEPATTPTPASGVVVTGVTFSANDWGVGLNGKVTFTGNTIQGQYYNSASITAGNAVTLSFIAKKQGGGEVKFGSGAGNDIFVSMQNTSSITTSTTNLGNDLWFCSATRISNGASANYGPIKQTTNTSTPVEVSAIMLTTGPSSGATLTLRPESYVKTTGNTTSTKAVETMVDVISGFTGGAAGGSWYLKLLNNTTQHRVGNGSLYVGSTSGSSTSGDVLRLVNDGTNTRLKVSKIVNNVPSSTLFVTTADTTSIVFTWNGSTANIYSNGSKVVTNTAFTGTTTLNYLIANGTDVAKYIKTMAIFPETLTDAEAISLTNI